MSAKCLNCKYFDYNSEANSEYISCSNFYIEIQKLSTKSLKNFYCCFYEEKQAKKFNISMEVEADTEEEALRKIKEIGLDHKILSLKEHK